MRVQGTDKARRKASKEDTATTTTVLATHQHAALYTFMTWHQLCRMVGQSNHKAMLAAHDNETENSDRSKTILTKQYKSLPTLTRMPGTKHAQT